MVPNTSWLVIASREYFARMLICLRTLKKPLPPKLSFFLHQCCFLSMCLARCCRFLHVQLSLFKTMFFDIITTLRVRLPWWPNDFGNQIGSDTLGKTFFLWSWSAGTGNSETYRPRSDTRPSFARRLLSFHGWVDNNRCRQ